MFKVTKRITSGTFAGMDISETTSVKFEVGFKVKAGRNGPAYEVVAVEAAMKEAA
jgi:hypothetical protein